MSKYASLVSKANIPQTEPLDQRQVANNAGGFVYELDDFRRLERFLILGSDSATYYQNARDLTRQNAASVEKCWAADPERTAAIIAEISMGGRAPKADPAIFAVALGVVSQDEAARKAAYGIVGKVCRTGTHLFQFVKTAMSLGKGFGRGMKRAVSAWYNNRSADKLAYQVVKYRMRETLRHDNLLHLAHPMVEAGTERWALGEWLHGRADKLENAGLLPALIRAHEAAMAIPSGGTKELLAILEKNDLPWEALPTWANADPVVQKALLPKAGLTALVRNLGNHTRIGAIGPLSAEEKVVIERLGSEEEIKASRIHPLQVLTALAVYSQGFAVRGGYRGGGGDVNRWTPIQSIVSALDGAFYKAFKNVVPTEKRHFIAVDCSGSMSSPFSGSAALTCAQAAAAMSLVIAKTEPSTFIGRFNLGIQPVEYSERSRLDDVFRQINAINGGGTDCALPMQYALAHKIPADVFIVITDNETYAGRIHPMEALRQYRKATGINAKLVVIGMTSTGFSISDPADPGCLDVVGFDTNVPSMINEFVR